MKILLVIIAKKAYLSLNLLKEHHSYYSYTLPLSEEQGNDIYRYPLHGLYSNLGIFASS